MSEEPFLDGRERVSTRHTSHCTIVFNLGLQELYEKQGKRVSTGLLRPVELVQQE